MADVPQIVRQRLDAATPPASHPDPDVLTAFSERALPEAERNTVLDHLARCSECREIVVLALPNEEPVQVSHIVRERRFSWPVLRWGFIAAGIAIIASFGILQYQRHAANTARLKTSAAVTATTDAENKPAPEPTSTEARNEKKLSETPQRKAKAKESALGKEEANPAAGTPVAGLTFGGPVKPNQLVHGPKMSNQWQQNSNTFPANINQAQGVPAAPAPVPYPKQQLSPSHLAANAPTTGGSAEPSNASISSTQLHPLVVQSRNISELKSNDGVADTRIDRAKPPLERRGISKVPAPLDGADVSLAKATPAPRWTINSSGNLQRSYDQGRSWQDVNVSASPAASSSVTANRVYRAAAKDSAAAAPASAAPAPAPQFRAVAVNGADVWVGGSSGTLYHSIDAGLHWIRIVPGSNGVSLTGDVLSVDFPDPQHGKISTSTGEFWTTGDAGQSWQKQ